MNIIFQIYLKRKLHILQLNTESHKDNIRPKLNVYLNIKEKVIATDAAVTFLTQRYTQRYIFSDILNFS